MKVRRGLVHMQHHVEHPEMGVALLKGFCELRQRLGCPPATLRAAAAVAEISDLEDGRMEQLLLLILLLHCKTPLFWALLELSMTVIVNMVLFLKLSPVPAAAHKKHTKIEVYQVPTPSMKI